MVKWKPFIRLNQLQKQSTVYDMYIMIMYIVCFNCKCVVGLTVVIKVLLASLRWEKLREH